LHLLTSDIPFTLRNDIERERITASWRGYRHLSGLKVRGQRTRTSGRKGGAVGVAKGGLAAVRKGDPGAPGADAAAPADAAADAAAPADAAAEKKGAPAAEKKGAPTTEKKGAPTTEKKEAPAEKTK